MEVDKQQFWIFELFINRKSLSLMPNIVFSGFFMSFPIIVIFLPFIFRERMIFSTYTSSMWLGLISGSIWIYLAPYLIFQFYKRLATLSIELQSIISKNNDIYFWNALDTFKKTNIFNVLWCVLICCALLLDVGYLNKFGIYGFGDPYLYVFILCIAYIAYFTGFGFKGVYVTIIIIKNLTKNKVITIDYFNADGSGGIKYLKGLSAFTARVFATGTLFIPILVDYILYTNNLYVKLILYLSIFLMVLFIASSFIIPVKLLIRHIESQKNEYLKKLLLKYKTVAFVGIDNPNNHSIQEEIEALNLYNYINICKNTKIYTVDYSVIMEILVSVAIPLMGLFISWEDIVLVFQTIFIN